jgi:uncharacterized membrane protein
LLAALAGGALLHRGLTGHCYLYSTLGIDTAQPHAVPGYRAEGQVVIDRSCADVYRAWRNLAGLPSIMSNLVLVSEIGNGRSHWIAKGPIGSTVQWDAEIINERENEIIAWRSLPGSQVAMAGSVRCEPTDDGKGTVLHVQMLYNPPAGKPGATLAEMLGRGLQEQLDEDLGRFKQTMEAGEIARAPLGGV